MDKVLFKALSSMLLRKEGEEKPPKPKPVSGEGAGKVVYDTGKAKTVEENRKRRGEVVSVTGTEVSRPSIGALHQRVAGVNRQRKYDAEVHGKHMSQKKLHDILIPPRTKDAKAVKYRTDEKTGHRIRNLVSPGHTPYIEDAGRPRKSKIRPSEPPLGPVESMARNIYGARSLIHRVNNRDPAEKVVLPNASGKKLRRVGDKEK